MKIQQLKLFIAVYEEGSFSAGAARVNATQSGLSMHVRALENRYGVKLLERTSTGVVPTEVGRKFYKRAVEVLKASALAEETLRDLSGSISGHISVGLMPTFTGSVLSPSLMRFSAIYPNVRVSILEAYSSTLSAQVSDGILDFAVVPAVNNDLGLETSLMADDLECLVCSAQNTDLTGRRVRLADLSPVKLVLPSSVNARRPAIESYLSLNGIKVSEVMELDAMLGTLDIVANSDWLSILPSVLGRADRDGSKRRFLLLDDPPLGVKYMRVSNKTKPLSTAAQAFADVLQEELNSALEFED